MKLPHTLLEDKHLPVMIDEVLKICNPKSGEYIMDCTFGAGGYSKEFLKFQNTKVVALDRDDYVIEIANKLKVETPNLKSVNSRLKLKAEKMGLYQRSNLIEKLTN